MANHKKPTPEELEKQTQEAIAEAERLAGLAPEPDSEDPNPPADPPLDPEPEGEPEGEEEVEEEEAEAEPSEEEKAELQRRLDEEKRRTSASARENQKINAKNRVMNQALAEADELPEPTEEELIKEFGESNWDVMSETERVLAKESLINKRFRAKVREAKEQSTKIEKWNESVNEFIEKPQTTIDTPELEGKQEDFKEFATQPENNNVPFNLLVSAFLHDQSKKKVNNKGGMFPSGTGGPNTKPVVKSEKLSLEEGRKLRESNYNKWKEMNNKGLIDTEI